MRGLIAWGWSKLAVWSQVRAYDKVVTDVLDRSRRVGVCIACRQELRQWTVIKGDEVSPFTISKDASTTVWCGGVSSPLPWQLHAPFEELDLPPALDAKSIERWLSS